MALGLLTNHFLQFDFELLLELLLSTGNHLCFTFHKGASPIRLWPSLFHCQLGAESFRGKQVHICGSFVLDSEPTSFQFLFMVERCGIVNKLQVPRLLQLNIRINMTLALNQIDYIYVVLIFKILIWRLWVYLVAVRIVKFELFLIVIECSSHGWT